MCRCMLSVRFGDLLFWDWVKLWEECLWIGSIFANFAKDRLHLA